MELLCPFNYTKALHKSVGNSLFYVGLPVRLMNNIPKILGSLGQGLQSHAFKTCKGHLCLKCPEALSSFSGLKQTNLRAWLWIWSLPGSHFWIWEPFPGLKDSSEPLYFLQITFENGVICSLCRVSPLILLQTARKSQVVPSALPRNHSWIKFIRYIFNFPFYHRWQFCWTLLHNQGLFQLPIMFSFLSSNPSLTASLEALQASLTPSSRPFRFSLTTFSGSCQYPSATCSPNQCHMF